MYTVFNELSVHPNLSNYLEKENARQTINQFVEILVNVKRLNKFKGLITTQDIYNFEFLSNYSIHDWFKDPVVEKKYKDALRTFFNQKCSNIDYNDYQLSEFEINLDDNKYKSIGCLVASEMDENVMSLATREPWTDDVIEGQLSSIDIDTNKIFSENRKLNNISEVIHIEQLEQKSKDVSFEMLSSGQDLWEKKEELFPNLVFCESVKDQLYDNPQKFHIEQVAKKLKRMQQYFSEYNGIYEPKELGLDARTESETVKTNPVLKRFRLFTKPDGTDDYFFDHIGFTGMYCGRIHFLPEKGTNKCYIGYVGNHLPTKKY